MWYRENEIEGCQPQAHSSNVPNNLTLSYLFERQKKKKRLRKGEFTFIGSSLSCLKYSVMCMAKTMSGNSVEAISKK